MATAAEITTVRQNVNEPDDSGGYTDAIIGALIDEGDTDSAAASIWLRKAAEYAELVDTSEAGTSHKFSDLHKNALTMATRFGATDAAATESGGRARVHKIVRS